MFSTEAESAVKARGSKKNTAVRRAANVPLRGIAPSRWSGLIDLPLKKQVHYLLPHACRAEKPDNMRKLQQPKERYRTESCEFLQGEAEGSVFAKVTPGQGELMFSTEAESAVKARGSKNNPPSGGRQTCRCEVSRPPAGRA